MRAFPVLLASVLLLATPAAADVFTIRGVEVDETAATATQAQEQAIAVAQQIAAQRLIERLTLPEDRIGIPPIDAGRAARLVSGRESEEEAYAGSRYIGRLTISFDPDLVRDLLEEYGIPYVLSTSRPAVVVPLYRNGEEVVLWGTGAENPWFDAWAIAGTVDELVPVIAPSGDLSDIAVIDAERARALDKDALQALAANYGAAHVLVTLAQSAGGPSGEEGLMTARLVGIDFANGGAQTDYGNVGPAGPVELARAAAALLQDGWRRSMAVAEPSLTTASVSVLYGSVGEWMTLQGVVAGEPLVQRTQLDALTDDGALLTIEYRGTPQQLAMVLREHGAELTEAENGFVVRGIAGLQPSELPGGAPGEPGGLPGQPGALPGQPGALPAGGAPAVAIPGQPAGQAIPVGQPGRPAGQ